MSQFIKRATLMRGRRGHNRASAARSGTKSRSKGKRAKPLVHHKTRSSSKQVAVLALLGRSDGATVTAIMEATGWQAHSVRGFLAGVVRKKLGLNLESEKTDGKRVYRLTGKPDEGTEPVAACSMCLSPS